MIKLDHVVYFTKKTPFETVSEQKAMDWHSVVGGHHEEWGTHNALMYLKNAYIEWLSVEHQDVAEMSNHQLVELLLQDIDTGENWGSVCFSVNGIDSFNEKIRAIGFETSGVMDAERKTVTGDVRKWKMLFINQQPSDNLPLPFFIEWEEADDVRFNKLREDGTMLHDNEMLEITECIFSVSDPRKEAAEWAKLFSLEVKGGTIINLQNVTLKFIEKVEENVKERLSEVVIEHTGMV